MKSTKSTALHRYYDSRSLPAAVFDVGVNSQTAELIALFPKIKHYLFEPDDTHLPAIEKNYSSIDYTLHRVALSDEENQGFLVKRSLHKNGVATHSSLKAEPEAVDGKDTVSCEEFNSCRFDSMGISVPNNSLLKIDTDGSDLPVIKGFGSFLKNFEVVICEAITAKIAPTAAYLQANGFLLTDICDRVYYGSALYQVDLFFVRLERVDENYKPNIKSGFRRDLWRPVD
ncbi:methyltransferase FkbM family [Thiorhodococcus drewsii AZ1]|uniref:Methyltransferase FkbM family n=1 Tax=Thiorhodococcus drewsii AZ1 TaxID=765913 RepID=G2E5X3_9GAMM|nr:FkbM family methyltransferase [Thiorhodococcus drewsii]EGV28536.1 methyltransferase FkbM family [Thiorhodococcus drewsii AZ1]